MTFGLRGAVFMMSFGGDGTSCLKTVRLEKFSKESLKKIINLTLTLGFFVGFLINYGDP